MANIKLPQKHSNTKQPMDEEVINLSRKHSKKKYLRHMTKTELSQKIQQHKVT